MGKASIKYEIIRKTLSDNNNKTTLTKLCKIAGVSRSGYYKWINTEPDRKAREERDVQDFKIIQEAYAFRGYDKGIRGIYMRLKLIGVTMNIKKIRRLCRKYGLNCPIRAANPYRRMAKAVKENAHASNILDRNFDVKQPRTKLTTDITYIPYVTENRERKFLYFTPILDVATKEILTFKISDSLEIDFVLDLIKDLVEKYQDVLDKDCLLHTDQGVHYTSKKYIEMLENSDIKRSMSRRGNCWDNAPQESFFGHMKDELMDKIKEETDPKNIIAIIEDWVDYYNNDRCIWKLNKLSPKLYNESLLKMENGVLPLGEDDRELDKKNTLS